MLHAARRIKSCVGILSSQALGPVRDRVRNPAASSQEWQRNDNPFSSAWRPVRGVCVSVQAQGDLRVRGIENQLAKDEVGQPQCASLRQAIP